MQHIWAVARHCATASDSSPTSDELKATCYLTPTSYLSPICSPPFRSSLGAAMSAPVTVYGPVISPAVARVAACLLEKDVPFQLQPVDMSKGEHKSPSFLKLQPFGQVPAFKDHLTTVFESRAICRYICDQYAERGNRTLLGREEDGAVGRAAIEQWVEAEGQAFNPPSLAIAFQLTFAPLMGMATDMAVVEQNEAKLAKVLDVYEQRLGESQYFAGDEFTLADLVHMPNTELLVSKTNKAGLITERKNLARWWDEVSVRPAWKKVVEMQWVPRPSKST